MSKFILGNEYQDSATGFSGTAIKISEHLGGVTTVTLATARAEMSILSGRIADVENEEDIDEDDVDDTDEETTPPPPPPENGVPELDKDGVPWDEGIHSGARSKTKDGKWKKRKGVDPQLYTEVTAELQQKWGITEQKLTVAKLTGENPTVPTDDDSKSGVEAQVPPPPPPQNETGGTYSPGSPALVLAQKVGKMLAAGAVTIQAVDAIAQGFGVDNYRAIIGDAANAAFIPLMEAELEKLNG